MPQVAVRSEHTLISSMRVSPDRTVYRCVLAEVLSSGWRWPDLRLGILNGDGFVLGPARTRPAVGGWPTLPANWLGRCVWHGYSDSHPPFAVWRNITLPWSYLDKIQCDVAGPQRPNRRGLGCRHADGGRLRPRREATTPGNLNDVERTAHLLLPHVPRGTQARQLDSPFLPDREVEVVRELVHAFTMPFHAPHAPACWFPGRRVRLSLIHISEPTRPY